MVLLLGGFPLTVATSGGSRLPGLGVRVESEQDTLILFSSEGLKAEFQDIPEEYQAAFSGAVGRVETAVQGGAFKACEERKQAEEALTKLLQVGEPLASSFCISNNLAVVYVLQNHFDKALKVLEPMLGRTEYGDIKDPAQVREVREAIAQNRYIALRRKMI
jgi:hypothetical protein